MCLVLGTSDAARIDNTLVDKRSILTTKNILSLRKIEDKMAKIGGQSVIMLWEKNSIATFNTLMNYGQKLEQEYDFPGILDVAVVMW